MRLLLDTCTFIWLASEPARISPDAAAKIDDAANEMFLSHASVWEICLKHSAGKLNLPDEPERWLSDQLAARGVKELPIEFQSLTASARLPAHHRDPFDRLLVAQAKLHSMKLITPDAWISKYDADVIW